MSRPLRTVLVGLGRMGVGYAEDPLTARHYRHASHAQALAAHPAFAWEAAVDPDPAALAAVRDRWGIRHTAASMADLVARYEPEVMVLATPPGERLAALEPCRALRAVLAEKPLGRTPAETRAFLDACAARGVMVQVNLWRRCDATFRALAGGDLARRLGGIQAVSGFYGNGLLNNGTHMVDAVRLLFGEIERVQALGVPRRPDRLPIPGDLDVSCALGLAGGLTVVLHALDFAHYREVGLDIWGEEGRLCLLNEGLTVELFPRAPHRAVTGEREIACDRPETLAPTAGEALWQVYEDLARALAEGGTPSASGEEAWRSAVAVEAVRRSAETGAPVATAGFTP